MPRRKLENKNIRKIIKVGGGKSYSIVIPIEMIRSLKWKEKQKVVVKQRGKKITIEDWKKKKY
jgi:bifunctional DNA-binding transcriptional regulator/antitoxin component of YhaV-PrlF toxin-antitoxin module